MSKVLERLPSMSMRDMATLWTNAVRILADKKKNPQHAEASIVLNAVGKEWTRRTRASFNPDEFFDWPSTDAPGGAGNLRADGWLEDGLLSYLGYAVGSSKGERQGVRERILEQIFEGPLPPAFPKPYLDQWGTPSSANRLQKLAETIAAFTRNAKRRRSASMNAAIRDWESDLQFLFDKYYEGKFGFSWPDTSILE